MSGLRQARPGGAAHSVRWLQTGFCARSPGVLGPERPDAGLVGEVNWFVSRLFSGRNSRPNSPNLQ